MVQSTLPKKVSVNVEDYIDFLRFLRLYRSTHTEHGTLINAEHVFNGFINTHRSLERHRSTLHDQLMKETLG